MKRQKEMNKLSSIILQGSVFLVAVGMALMGVEVATGLPMKNLSIVLFGIGLAGVIGFAIAYVARGGNLD